jgi:hypothetical protein
MPKGTGSYRNNSRRSARDLAHLGGQYAPARGTSTSDKTDRQTDLEALEDFNAEWERYRYGVVSGREW